MDGTAQVSCLQELDPDTKQTTSEPRCERGDAVALSSALMNLALCRPDLKCRTRIGLNLERCVYSGSESTRVWKAINCTLCELRSPCSISWRGLATKTSAMVETVTISNRRWEINRSGPSACGHYFSFKWADMRLASLLVDSSIKKG